MGEVKPPLEPMDKWGKPCVDGKRHEYMELIKVSSMKVVIYCPGCGETKEVKAKK